MTKTRFLPSKSSQQDNKTITTQWPSVYKYREYFSLPTGVGQDWILKKPEELIGISNGLKGRHFKHRLQQGQRVRRLFHLGTLKQNRYMVKTQQSRGVLGDKVGEKSKDQISSSPIGQAKQFTLNFIHSYQKATENFSIWKLIYRTFLDDKTHTPPPHNLGGTWGCII